MHDEKLHDQQGQLMQSYIAPTDGAIKAWKQVTDFNVHERITLTTLSKQLCERYGFSEIKVWGLLEPYDYGSGKHPEVYVEPDYTPAGRECSTVCNSCPDAPEGVCYKYPCTWEVKKYEKAQ